MKTSKLLALGLLDNAIKWLLNDNFTGTLAAGAVNGTYASDGRNLRMVVDTESKLSISGGLCLFSGKTVPVYNDPLLVYNTIPQARIVGRILLAKITKTVSGIGNRFGACSVFGFGTSGFYSWQSLIVVANYSLNIPYVLAIVQRTAAGAFFFVRGDTYTNFTLVGIEQIESAPTSFGMDCKAATATCDFIHIPAQTWLLVPLASDSFNRADGAIGNTDGAGHAEANGGGGLPWTGGAISSNALAITPTQEGDIVLNGDMEAGDPPTSWSTYHGTRTRETTIIHSGSASLKFVSLDTNASAIQNLTTVAGKWYLISFWGYGDANASRIEFVRSGTPYTIYTFLALANGVWTNALMVGRVDDTATQLRGWTNVNGATMYLDDAVVYPLTLATLFSSLQISTVNVVVDCEVSVRTPGTQCGLVARLDSAVTPANFILAYFNGDGYVKCEECVSGVYTALMSPAVKVWSAGDYLRLDLSGTAWRLYHITAAGIASLLGSGTTNVVTGNLCGGFSTYAANRINSLVVWAKGNEGQYDYLNRFIQA